MALVQPRKAKAAHGQKEKKRLAPSTQEFSPTTRFLVRELEKPRPGLIYGIHCPSLFDAILG